jgi:hypothetical protein
MSEKKPLFHTPKIWKVNAKWVWPIRILLLCAAWYFAQKTYYSYSAGVIDGRYQDYTLENSPIFFSLMLILYFLTAIGAVWQSFRVRQE